MRNYFRKIQLLIAGIFSGIVIFFIVFEIGLRIFNRSDYQLKSAEETPLIHTLNSKKDEWISTIIQSKDLLLRFEFDPRNKIYTNHCGYKINSLGFCDKERKIKKEKNVYRIAVIGDSITAHGWYCKYLEEWLNAGNLRYNFEVWNCGVIGYDLLQYFAVLRNKVIKFKPDLIIISFCLNDLSITPIMYKDNRGKWICYRNNMGPARFPVNTWLFIKSYAYRFLISHISLRSKYEFTEDKVNWLIKEINEIIRVEEVGFFTVTIPFLKSSYAVWEQSQYEEINRVLGKNKIFNLDLHGKFKDIDSPKWRFSEDDYMHPSEEGHKVIAREIYKYIIYKYFKNSVGRSE